MNEVKHQSLDVEVPEECGRRLLHKVIDARAASSYPRPFVSIPRTNDPKNGFQDISYKQFANAINRCCWLLDKELGKSLDFDTFAYLGPLDLRYLILYFAAMKTMRKAFMPSPRNSMVAHLSLLREVKCRAFIMPLEPPPIVADIMQEFPLPTLALPELRDLLDETLVPCYPYNKTYDEAWMDPFALLHTSGSTGIPKAITIRHVWTSQLDKYQDFARYGFGPGQAALTRKRRMFVAFPPFHSAALLFMCNCNTWYESTLVLPPPVSLTAEVANSVHVHGDVQVTAVVPSILVDLAKNPVHLKNLSLLESVIFAGGPIPKASGDIISKHTYLFNCIGATECGLWLLDLHEDREDWEYYKFNDFNGLEFRHVSDDFFEAVMVRDPKLEPCQVVFYTLPDIGDEYHTKDLYSKHPTKDGFWLYRGRADDVLVFTNGEKLNPLTAEQLISTHPEVNSALFVGHARFRPALLIEPVTCPSTEKEEEALLVRIWPYVHQSNKDSVAHGRISKDYVIFTTPEKPFLRAGKGTIQRQMTVAQYDQEINALYHKAHVEKLSSAASTSVAGMDDLESFLMTTVTDQMGRIDLNLDTDLFHHGLDSLQVINLVAGINAFGQAEIASTQMIYSNPTVRSLAKALRSPENGSFKFNEADAVSTMQDLLRKFSADLPITTRPVAEHEQVVVIITGTTGSLGSYLLNNLLLDPRVVKVYCLNRSANARDRQEEGQHFRGLESRLEVGRVEFLQSDLSRPYLGLKISTYRQLLAEVTHVIHNAWTVDFNFPLSHFETTHINGVRQFIDFCTRSTYGAQIVFISSISAVSNWQDHETAVPERILLEWDVPAQMGYGQSKYVCERLLDMANRISNVKSTILRVGQIAGPVLEEAKGAWGKQEWLPSLIASSRYLCKIPSDLGPLNDVDWIPVDILAQTIGELVLQPEEAVVAVNGKHDTAIKSSSESLHETGNAPTVFHLVNPNSVPWSVVLPAILSHFPSDTRPEVIPLASWVDSLRLSSHKPAFTNRSVDKSHLEIQNVQANPSIKLLPWFEALSNETLINADARVPRFDTSLTQNASPRLSRIGPVNEQWMRLWMAQWNF